jgi:hypothetical protein
VFSGIAVIASCLRTSSLGMMDINVQNALLSDQLNLSRNLHFMISPSYSHIPSGLVPPHAGLVTLLLPVFSSSVYAPLSLSYSLGFPA